MRVDGRTYQFHNDHKGSPRWLTGPLGEIAWSGVTSGFGAVDVRHGSVRQPFRFPGQYCDEETGLHCNRARFYSPVLGRYLSRDPADLVGGINLYAYVNNDPINGADPLGLFDWGAAALLTGGIVLGAVVTAVLLPEIALTAAGLLAAAAVVTAAALVAGSVAALATDVMTDGCVPCMKAAFEKGALAGLRVGSEVVLILLTAGAAAPPLLLAEGGAFAITGQGLGAAAVAVAAAAGVMTSGSDNGGGSDESRKADAQRNADKRDARDLQKRSSNGDKDATTQLNDKKAADARANGDASSAEGYDAENKVIRDPDNKVVKAGEQVKYSDPNNPGHTVATDIDAESDTQVIQVKSGGDPPSYNQAQATRLHAAETGKQPRLIYDPAKMDPDKLAQFPATKPRLRHNPAEPALKRHEKIMSFDFTACFTLGTVDPSLLKATLGSFGIQFGGCHSRLVFNGKWVEEQQTEGCSWTAFADNAVSSQPSAFAQFEADEFRFMFGFVTLPTVAGPSAADIRAAWLVISDGDLDRMTYALEDRGTDGLKLFVGIFRALGAKAMAMGVEPSARQFLQFFAGGLPVDQIDALIHLAIAPPAQIANVMRGNPGIRELNLDGRPVLTRNFMGLDDYFTS